MASEHQADALKTREAAIVVVDVVSFSSIVSRRGDLDAISVLNQFLNRAARAVEDHNVRISKFLGDGFLAIFDRTLDALKFAIDFQQSLRDNPIGDAGGNNLQARIAIHSDQILVKDTQYGGEVFGTGINLAARLESLGGPGSVVLSDRAYRQLPPDLGALFTEHKNFRVKGFQHETTAWFWSASPGVGHAQ